MAVHRKMCLRTLGTSAFRHGFTTRSLAGDSSPIASRSTRSNRDSVNFLDEDNTTRRTSAITTIKFNVGRRPAAMTERDSSAAAALRDGRDGRPLAMHYQIWTMCFFAA